MKQFVQILPIFCITGWHKKKKNKKKKKKTKKNKIKFLKNS